ncbi:HTH-type transcriptional regulator Hpr [Bacillus cereus]
MIFSQRIAQLSKALWKCVEKDWQQWIKPYDLNINEHHILTIAYHLKGASISEIAKFGVMHVSTAFNFSKKARRTRLSCILKKRKMINEIRTLKLQTKGKNYYFA